MVGYRSCCRFVDGSLAQPGVFPQVGFCFAYRNGFALNLLKTRVCIAFILDMLHI